MERKTPLYDQHVQLAARMVDFAGYQMPLHYGSQIDEHHVVRQSAGVFDVSHMCVVDLAGSGAEAFLRRLLANDVARLNSGQALYTCMLNETGGVIDDLIVYRRATSGFRLVVNAGTRDKDLAWLREQAGDELVNILERIDLSILAVQGPNARQAAARALKLPAIEAELKRFYAYEDDDVFVGRTGYTGEDGVEIILPNESAEKLWCELLNESVTPCGLGSRDSLRLEAGLNLYGQDMDDTTSPWISNLGWTVSLKDPERHFIGRSALETEQLSGPEYDLVGVVLLGRGIMRHGQVLQTSVGAGVVTSGGFSPTLSSSVALARVPRGSDEAFEVEIRNKNVKAKKVPPPFVRAGKATFEI